jgi:RNA polymerase sigma factor (sigma-70 family)
MSTVYSPRPLGPASTVYGPRTVRYARPVAAEEEDGRELGVRFASGEAELREVYDAYGSLVYGVCRRTLDGDSAKDVTQEVFVSAWRGRDQFDPERGALGAWLVGITKRRVIDHVRRERRHDDRRADDTPASIPLAAPVDGTTPDVDRIAHRMIVADALRQLPERARHVIGLAYIDDLTHQEIAEQTGIPLGTVKSDIRRGLARIRSLIEPMLDIEEVTP